MLKGLRHAPKTHYYIIIRVHVEVDQNFGEDLLTYHKRFSKLKNMSFTE